MRAQNRPRPGASTLGAGGSGGEQDRDPRASGPRLSPGHPPGGPRLSPACPRARLGRCLPPQSRCPRSRLCPWALEGTGIPSWHQHRAGRAARLWARQGQGHQPARQGCILHTYINTVQGEGTPVGRGPAALQRVPRWLCPWDPSWTVFRAPWREVGWSPRDGEDGDHPPHQQLGMQRGWV